MDLRDFTDSTPIITDGPALAARMAEDGYLFFRGLLPRDEVAEVRRQFLAKADKGGWLRRDRPDGSALADLAHACKDPEPGYLKTFVPMWQLESLHRLKSHPNIVGVFERMFGGACLVHPLLVARNIFPQTDSFDFTTGAHQDRIHIGGGTSYACWVPLGDCPREKGSLIMAAGSHKEGVRDFTIAAGAGGLETVGDFAGQWVGSDFAMGDAVIFVDTIVHKALPNRSPDLRQSFDARYQRLSDPIAEVSVRTYADMCTWEETYANWQRDDLKYYWRRPEVRVVPFDRSYYEKRDAIAFDLAARGDLLARDSLLRIIQRDPDAAKRGRAQAALEQLEAATA
jgi:hypothetical protein